MSILRWENCDLFNNLCGGKSAGCDVDVTITKFGIGDEDDKVLAVVSAYADTN